MEEKSRTPRKASDTGMITIDPQKLQAAIYRAGKSLAEAGAILGYSAGYFAGVKKEGKMRKATAKLLEVELGISPEEYTGAEEPELIREAPKTLTAVEIRSAVCNGVMDAVLMVTKDGLLKSIVKDLFQEEATHDAIQYAIYSGIYGAAVKLERDGYIKGGGR